MRKTILVIFMLCGLSVALPAQDIRTLFIEAPDSVLPSLPRSVRADCVDFADAGMNYPVSNIFDGKSVLKELDDDHLLLQSTAVSTVEMKLLPAGDSYVVCVVKTVFAEAADSRIAFFDHDWKRLDTGLYFTPPAIKDFFAGEDNKVLDMCDIYLVSLKLDSEKDFVVAEYTMPDYMNSDDAGKVRSSLRKIVYRWDGKRFVMER